MKPGGIEGGKGGGGILWSKIKTKHVKYCFQGKP